MIKKEIGYDEFLAEQIRLGQDDFNSGRVISLKDAQQQWQHTIEKKLNYFCIIIE